MTTPDLTKYKWFQYDENASELIFDQPRHNEDYELQLHPGNIYGVKTVGRTYFVVHKNSPDIQFVLDKAEIVRITDKSAGWSGKVRKQTVNAGIGGKDKPIETLPEGWREIELDSSNLRTAIYNPKAKILYITFHNGASWAYEGVTKREFDEMEAFESRGRYFIYRIRDVKYQYKLGDNFDRPPYDATPTGTRTPPKKSKPDPIPPKSALPPAKEKAEPKKPGKAPVGTAAYKKAMQKEIAQNARAGKKEPAKKPKPSTFEIPENMKVDGRAKVHITHAAHPGKSTTKTWSGVGFEWLGSKHPELGRILGELYTNGTSQVDDGKGIATLTLDGEILIPK